MPWVTIDDNPVYINGPDLRVRTIGVKASKARRAARRRDIEARTDAARQFVAGMQPQAPQQQEADRIWKAQRAAVQATLDKQDRRRANREQARADREKAAIQAQRERRTALAGDLRRYANRLEAGREPDAANKLREAARNVDAGTLHDSYARLQLARKKEEFGDRPDKLAQRRAVAQAMRDEADRRHAKQQAAEVQRRRDNRTAAGEQAARDREAGAEYERSLARAEARRAAEQAPQPQEAGTRPVREINHVGGKQIFDRNFKEIDKKNNVTAVTKAAIPDAALGTFQRVTVEAIPDAGFSSSQVVRVTASKNDAAMERTLIYKGGKIDEIHNDYFRLPENAPAGLGTKIFAEQVENARALGVNKITTLAAQGSQFNGYYTWARLGYDGSVRQDRLRSRPTNPEFARYTRVSQFMDTKEGRDFWKANGHSFDGTFDLSDGSASLARHKAYLAERKAAGR